MISVLHEALLELFRNRPALAAELAAGLLEVPLPHFAEARVEEANLTNLKPAEYRADLVIVLRSRDAPVYGFVVEAQLNRDASKQWAWPAYGTNLRARLRCPAMVLVIAPDPATAKWAAQPIETGQPGCPFVPLVIGPKAIPVVRDLELASRAPELAVLSVLAHGDEADAVEIAIAAVHASAGLDDDRARLYYDLTLMALSEAARKALEELMTSGNYEYQSDFARKYFSKGRDEGKDEGKAEGRAEGRAEALFKILARRGIAVSNEQRARILACRDLPTLDRWLDLAFGVASTQEVLGSSS